MPVYRIGNNSYAVMTMHGGDRTQFSGGAANTAGTGYSLQDRRIGPTAAEYLSRAPQSRFFTFEVEESGDVTLNGTSDGVATISGSLSVETQLAATSPGGSTTSADLIVEVQLDGSSASGSTASASITVEVNLSGQSDGATQVSDAVLTLPGAIQSGGGGGYYKPIHFRREVKPKPIAPKPLSLRGQSKGRTNCIGRLRTFERPAVRFSTVPIIGQGRTLSSRMRVETPLNSLCRGDCEPHSSLSVVRSEEDEICMIMSAML